MEFLKLWEIFLRRKWVFIATFSLFIATALMAVFIIPPTYEATAKLLVQAPRSADSIVSTIGLKEFGQNDAVSEANYDTDITLATIRPLLEQLIAELGLKNRGGNTIKTDKLTKFSLLNKIWPQPYVEVSQYEDADILDITASSGDPREAAEMANKLADLYIRDILKRNSEEYARARGFIQDQLKRVKGEYYASLSRMKAFKISRGTVDLDLEIQNMVNKIDTVKNSIQENESNILELEKKIAQSEAKLKAMDRYRKDSEQLSQNDQVKTLKTTLNTLVIELEEKSLDITTEHQDYKQIVKKINAVKDLLKKEALMVVSNQSYGIDPVYEKLTGDLVNDYISKETAQVRKKVLARYLGEYQEQLMQMPLKAVDAAKLDLSLAVNKEMYQKLLEYMTQIGIAETMDAADKVLIESAVTPYEHVFPRKSVSLILACFFGLFWGTAMVVFFELIDNTIKSPHDLKKVLPLTLLGTIPYARQMREPKVTGRPDPTLALGEAFRAIRHNIRYLGRDEDRRSIVITSSLENEGKSHFIANLARAFAGAGKKVVLVDMNLRRPMLDKMFDLPDRGGVADILAENRPFHELVIESDVKGLYILPGGRIPADPTRLIESRNAESLIKALETAYDLVLIDTPPLIVHDPMVLGSLAGGVLLVIESGRVSFQMLEDMLAGLDQAGANIVGLALNKFKPAGSHPYHAKRNRYYGK